MRGAILEFQQKPKMAKAAIDRAADASAASTGVVVKYPATPTARARVAASRLPSKKRSASVASRRVGVAAAFAR
jgi:hypothetical protein